MSKMVVAYETNINSEKLKYILPTLAYYFTTGPWRIMWVRFGYDPRKDFESRYYQQLDYRITLNSGIKGHVSYAKMKKIAFIIKSVIYIKKISGRFKTFPYNSQTRQTTTKTADVQPYREQKERNHLLSVLRRRTDATV